MIRGSDSRVPIADRSLLSMASPPAGRCKVGVLMGYERAASSETEELGDAGLRALLVSRLPQPYQRRTGD